jgi:16S rRNA G966 N2-methylase RsmD
MLFSVMIESIPACFLNFSRKNSIRQLLMQYKRQKFDGNIVKLRFSSTSTNNASVTSIDGNSLSAGVCVVDFELDEPLRKIANDLSSKLSVPLIHTSSVNIYSFGIYVVPYACGNIQGYAIGINSLLPQSNDSKKRQSGMSFGNAEPFVLDFCPLAENRLVKRSMGQTGKDLLVKAVAPKRMRVNGASVLDLTAGLGQDSLVLAQSGASQVQMVEKNPIVSTLLGDALRRLHLLTSCNDYQIQKRALYLSERLKLTEGDGCHEARRIAQTEPTDSRPDVCYLDPMFPPRTKSSKVKKGMQLLHGLLESQKITTDSLLQEQCEAEFLLAAYDAALHRVVVKRPKNAPVFGGSVLVPSHQISGSVNRWDVYMKK